MLRRRCARGKQARARCEGADSPVQEGWRALGAMDVREGSRVLVRGCDRL